MTTALLGVRTNQCVATLQERVDLWSGWKEQHAERFRWVVSYDADRGCYCCERPTIPGRLSDQEFYEFAFVRWCDELATMAGVI